jgi:UDP-N-acetylmuramyl pentapeptide phosphotransferase/UDP-N-acetylglucosamine-1-phosphate transferase
MDDNRYYIMVALLSGLASALGTWVLLPVLRRRVMDMPNERSSHTVPVPRGGGIAMIAAALIGLAFTGLPVPIIAAAVLLAAVSFMDDLRGLSVKWRLLAQFIAVGLAIGTLPGDIFPEFVPHSLQLAAIALFWVWFINLTNFMDGIDGISAMQAIMTCVGIALIHWLRPWLPSSLAVWACVLAASCYGFYLFNRSPAKLFMGDVGSVPLGFLVGYLLLNLAADGYPLPALILPAYYLSDATLTLVRRLLRGDKVWQAHREHAYQKAVQRGFTHAQVVARISWLDAALIALAMYGALSMMAGVATAIAAYGLTFWLIHRLSHAAS